MPSMEWAQFIDAHFRPHLVSLYLESGPDMPLCAELERLAEHICTFANYSISVDDFAVRAAFERDVDAMRFAELVGATVGQGGPEWVSQSVCRLDQDTRRKLIASLRKTLRLMALGPPGVPAAGR